jgi:hypothetical protein
MKSHLLIVAILALLVIQTLATCKWTSPSGVDYDFTGSTHDEVKAQGDDAYSYSFSFCGGIPSNAKCAAIKNSPVSCIVNASNDEFLFAPARWDNTPAFTPVITERPTGGLTLEFNNGDEFPSKQKPQVFIDLDCGSTKTASKQDTTLPVIRLSIQHPLGCPANAGLSGGGIFLIVFFSVFAGYFIIGFLVCKFGLKKEGLDAIPQRGFWCALPGLYLAGCQCVIGRIRNKKGSGFSEENSGSGSTYGSSEYE